jgi:UDP-glucose 4-epimerase
MTVLVTGGAGYIGSHMVHALLDRGEKVVVLDNLSTGSRALVTKDAEFVQGDVGDLPRVGQLLNSRNVDAVIHFAGSIVVPESVQDPLAYYANNTVASRNLIAACVTAGVKRFVFSSTAAVYGSPEHNPVAESAPKEPINPYGRSKLMTEWMLEDTARAHPFSYIALRYFNVAGADPKGRTGQSTPKATHLIKRACQAALGRVSHLDIFGTDFPTRDGTGVRDYIHVTDLADAHALALGYLAGGGASCTLNCGYGRGFSVREVIDMVSHVAGHKLPVREGPRRAGDPAELVADPSLAMRQLGWAPQMSDLDTIVNTAWAWHRREKTWFD